MSIVKLVLEVDEKLIQGMLAAADKHHPWCDTVQKLYGAPKKSVRLLVHNARVARREQRLTKAKIVEGLLICAKECPDIFASFLQGSCNPIEADTVVQYSVFGKILF